MREIGISGWPSKMAVRPAANTLCISATIPTSYTSICTYTLLFILPASDLDSPQNLSFFRPFVEDRHADDGQALLW
jgi:hypothetical protein